MEGFELFLKNYLQQPHSFSRTPVMKKFKFPWTHSDQEKYTLLQDEDIQSPCIHTQQQGITSWSLLQIIFVFALCLSSSLAGFIFRGWMDGTTEQPMTAASQIPVSLNPLGTLVKTFEFNEIYSAAPSNKSNKAWEDNLPLGQGFMTSHSHISNISEFSVFHQLHCIDTIRHAYYAAVANRNTSVLGEHRTKKNHHHVTHCFDFLRQCVECAADTNIEPVDWDLGGVTGWGFERVCRDFESLKEHAQKWKVPGIE